MEIVSFITEQGLILIPALIIIGQIAKSVELFPDKFIPLLLLPFGLLGAGLLLGWSVEAIIQGLLITGTAVYGNQVWKQLSKIE